MIQLTQMSRKHGSIYRITQKPDSQHKEWKEFTSSWLLLLHVTSMFSPLPVLVCLVRFISVSHILLHPALFSNKQGLGWFEEGPKPLVQTKRPQKGVVSGRMHVNLGVAHRWCGRLSTKSTGGITLTHHFLWGDWRRSSWVVTRKMSGKMWQT